MSSDVPMLLVRADASSAIGTGHVMRGLALAQAWKASGGRVEFACAELPPALEARLRAEGFGVHAIRAPAGTAADAAQTALLASSLPSSLIPHPSSFPPWVCADGYRFGPEFQRGIRSAGLRLLLVDDYGSLQGYEADLLLNQNIDADRYRYPAGTAPRRLLGPRYALLRPEFASVPPRGTEPPAARRILVTMGGGDPDNVTTRVARALRGIADAGLDVRVLAGAAFPHRPALEAAIVGDARFVIVPFTDDMPGLMAWADLAVSAAGSTCWELLRVGVPFAAVVLAENQRGIAAGLGAKGCAVNLGGHERLEEAAVRSHIESLLRDPDRRTAMSERGRALVDGLGARRVIARMRALDLRLRRAVADDSRRLWAWANDPGVRAMSFHSEPIPWESHQRWFAAKLASPRTAIFIAEDRGGRPVGQIRFDGDEAETTAEVGISVDAARRGGGWGAALIRAGVDALFEATRVQAVRARIKRTNTASLRAFATADFDPAGDEDSADGDVACLVLRRPHE